MTTDLQRIHFSATKMKMAHVVCAKDRLYGCLAYTNLFNIVLDSPTYRRCVSARWRFMFRRVFRVFCPVGWPFEVRMR